MALLKYLSKFLTKYQEPTQSVNCTESTSEISTKLNLRNRLKKSIRSTGTSNLNGAKTTIISKKHISKVIESYTHLQNPIITIHKNSYRTNNHFNTNHKLVPIAESSTLSSVTESNSVCNTCTSAQKYEKPKKYCKCCGKELISNVKVNFQRSTTDNSRDEDEELLMQARDAYLKLYKRFYNTNENSIAKRHKRTQFGKLRSKQQNECCKRSNICSGNSSNETDQIYKFKNVSKRTRSVNTENKIDLYHESNKIAKSSMKKSKATSNMKQIEYKSFLSNKRKYSSAVSSTLQDNLRDLDQNKTKTFKHGNQYENTIIEEFIPEPKVCSTFVVDYASTPIKLAPKTSTPVKLRFNLKLKST